MPDENKVMATHMTVSAVLLVESLHLEFNAGCVVQGMCGELMPIRIWTSVSDPAEMERLSVLLQPGSLVRVDDADLHFGGEPVTYSLILPEIKPFEGDADRLRRSFEEQRPYCADEGAGCLDCETQCKNR